MRQLLTLLCFFTLWSVSGQNLLQYDLDVGDSFTIDQEAKQVITQEISGMKQIINNDIIGAMHFKVVQSEPDYLVMEMSFKKIKMTMSSPSLGELMSMDTTSETDDMMSLLMRGAIDQPVTIYMYRNGKINEVTGGDKLIENMFKNAGMTQPELINASKAQMEKQFGTKALTNSFEQMTFLFSEDEVNVNDTWSNEYFGDLNAKNTWTLSSIEGDNYYINGTADIAMKTTNDSVTMDLSGTQNTVVKGSLKTGVMVELLVNNECKGKSSINGMEIPTTIKSTITYKIAE